MTLKYSLLDFVWVDRGEPPQAPYPHVAAFAQAAEASGYERVWYAEQHNIDRIGATAPTILAAHAAEHTTRIRVGPGGVLLPNYSPLTVAEQYGTLAALHPGRIDLGIGRSAGGDPNTTYALRVGPETVQRYPDDVAELRSYLDGDPVIPGVRALPGPSLVPIYLLGSSLHGAQLAARLSLPYGFAAHFSPDLLPAALHTYRTQYQPSARHPEPYALITVNLIAAETAEEAHAQHRRAISDRRDMLDPRIAALDAEQRDVLAAGPAGDQSRAMMSRLAIGDPDTVHAYLHDLAAQVGADEVMLVPTAATRAERLHAIQLVQAPTS